MFRGPDDARHDSAWQTTCATEGHTTGSCVKNARANRARSRCSRALSHARRAPAGLGAVNQLATGIVDRLDKMSEEIASFEPT